ncbi:hypothetical protein BDP27DRAFT_1362205 [Rhodocollybia butyracea]|uniref:Uncharacterized protein n=1 Tax=Rhodocollybia butyracea TaxID=206335 RepID=A0A9P5PXC0_9AGAR|nr:hypothetical protein BDP27DRAFT_1362205 [Rhodocollybia butyracea]
MSVLSLWRSDTESEVSSVSSFTSSPRSSLFVSLLGTKQTESSSNVNVRPTCRPSTYDDPAGLKGGRVTGFYNVYIGALPGCYKVCGSREVSNRQHYIQYTTEADAVVAWREYCGAHHHHGVGFVHDTPFTITSSTTLSHSSSRENTRTPCSSPKKISAAELGIDPNELVTPSSTVTPHTSPKTNARLPDLGTPSVTIRKEKKTGKAPSWVFPTQTIEEPTTSEANASIAGGVVKDVQSLSGRMWWAAHTESFNAILQSADAEVLFQEAGVLGENIIFRQVSSIRPTSGPRPRGGRIKRGKNPLANLRLQDFGIVNEPTPVITTESLASGISRHATRKTFPTAPISGRAHAPEQFIEKDSAEDGWEDIGGGEEVNTTRPKRGKGNRYQKSDFLLLSWMKKQDAVLRAVMLYGLLLEEDCLCFVLCTRAQGEAFRLYPDPRRLREYGGGE